MNNSMLQNNSISNRLFFTIKDMWKNKWLYFFVIPGVIWFLIFCYYPMYGILIAFKTYDPLKGILASDWAPMGGFKYFIDFFTDINFSNIMINTIGISLLKLIIGFPAPIILAILLNEIKISAFKKVVQSISYLPFFVSWVVVFGIMYDFLSVDNGILNNILLGIGFIKEPIFWLGDSKYFWGISVFADIWKTVGYSSILYFAAIASINTEMYDAAIVDGARRLQQIWHIILPTIRPTILMMLILSMSGILNAGMSGILTSGFDQIYVFSNALNSSASTIIDTYVLNQGVFKSKFELATAVGVFKSVVGLIMLIITNFTVKALSEESLL